MICNNCSVELTNDNWYATMKENKHYCCIPSHLKLQTPSNRRNNPDRMFVNGKYIKRSHPLHKPGRYESFGELAFSSLENYNTIKEGYVYAISNPAWPDWVKIGKAIDADDRLSGYQTSSPMRDYTLIHSVYFKDRSTAERNAHSLASNRTSKSWDKGTNGEWFYLTNEQAIQVLKDTTDES